jgi:hypothetical protein
LGVSWPSPRRGQGRRFWHGRTQTLEGTSLAEYNAAFAENPEWADFNILPIFFA